VRYLEMTGASGVAKDGITEDDRRNGGCSVIQQSSFIPYFGNSSDSDDSSFSDDSSDSIDRSGSLDSSDSGDSNDDVSGGGNTDRIVRSKSRNCEEKRDKQFEHIRLRRTTVLSDNFGEAADQVIEGNKCSTPVSANQTYIRSSDDLEMFLLENESVISTLQTLEELSARQEQLVEALQEAVISINAGSIGSEERGSDDSEERISFGSKAELSTETFKQDNQLVTDSADIVRDTSTDILNGNLLGDDVAQADVVAAVTAEQSNEMTIADRVRLRAAETPVSPAGTALRELRDLVGESRRFIAERRRRSREMRFETLRRMSIGSATGATDTLCHGEPSDLLMDLPRLQQSTPIRALRSRGAVPELPNVQNKPLEYRQWQRKT
jgi:hypothetical protein